MAPKPRRNRQGRARGRPAPRRLEDDLKRHRLARDVVPDLIAATETFLEFFPRIARRRASDRIESLSDLASDVLAWTALGAPRDESELPMRCFAASCLLDSDPHRLSWRTLAMSGIGDELRSFVRLFASEAIRLPGAPPDPEWLRGAADSVLDDVRAFTERLRAQQATSADGLRVGRQLLGGAIAVDPALAEDGVVGSPALGALGFLDRALPTDDQANRAVLIEILLAMASALPALVEHAAGHLGDDEEDRLEVDWESAELEGEEEDDDEEDDDEPGFSLDGRLAALDGRLRLTEEPSEGADVALRAARVLLIQGVSALYRIPSTFDARVRAIVAGDVLFPAGEGESGTVPREAGDGRALREMVYSRAAALLETAVPERPRAPEPGDLLLSRLDGLVRAMLHLADHDLVDELAGALAAIGGAVQALQTGVQLGHPDADLQRRMAASLGALDPLALADLPELRAVAALALRELAREASQEAAPARPWLRRITGLT